MARRPARRAGLDRAAVVEAATAIADEQGLRALGVVELARRLRVKPPSLYNHVGSLVDLRRELALAGMRGLGQRLTDAAVGRSGDEALRTMAHAYRAFARAHPGLYAAAQTAPPRADVEAQAAAGAVVEVVARVLAAYRLAGDESIHAVRAFRSALHGFVSLEAAGGFGLPADVDGSFERLTDLLAAGLRKRRT